MSKPSPPLQPYEKNYTSQGGEDGIIEHAMGVIPGLNRWCVEFGAWDGKYLSNTYNLIDRFGYSAILIEADPGRFAELKETYAGRPQVIPLNRFVRFEGADSLDCILSNLPIPYDFDLLSIDIDGNDYHIWDSLKNFRPKLVVIEFNPSIPNEIDFVQARDMHVAQGSSLTALYKLGIAKGYRLIHATTVNAFFVDNKYFPLFGIADDDPALLRADLSQITFLFQTFDGEIHIDGNTRMLWHGIPMLPSQLQALPRFLRTYPTGYNLIQRISWKIYFRYYSMKAFFALRKATGRRE